VWRIGRYYSRSIPNENKFKRTQKRKEEAPWVKNGHAAGSQNKEAFSLLIQRSATEQLLAMHKIHFFFF
jgi:hypothetical protein